MQCPQQHLKTIVYVKFGGGGGGVGQTECIMGHSKIENWNQLKKRITVFRAGIKYDLKEGVDQPNSFIV